MDLISFIKENNPELYNKFEEAKEKSRITQPDLIAKLASAKIGKKNQEHFMVYTLNGASEIIKGSVLSIGTANLALVHPRDVFRAAILDNATAIIIVHNHPSGNTTPSSEDVGFTRRIKESGEILGIKLLDSVIVTKNEDMFTSMARSGSL